MHGTFDLMHIGTDQLPGHVLSVAIGDLVDKVYTCQDRYEHRIFGSVQLSVFISEQHAR